MRDDLPGDVVTATRTVTTIVECVRGDDTLADSLPLLDASLDVDTDNQVPGLLTARFAGDLAPRHPLAPLAPFGQRLRLTHVVTVAGVDHALSLGEYLVSDVDYDGDATNVRAQSLEYLILDARLTAPFAPASTFAATLRRLCAGIVDVDIDPALTDRSLTPRDDWADTAERLDIVRDLETDWPARFTIDDDGILIARPPAARAGTPARSWRHGHADAYVTVGVSSTRESFYNGYVQKFTGNDGLDRQRAVVDDDPASPTYWNGPFGQRPRFAYSPSIVSWADAESAARAGLARELRRARQITVDAPPDPRVEPFDTVAVTLADGTNYTGLVVGLTLPLTAGDAAARYIVGDVTDA